jgi:hypothetical protein
MLRFQYPPDSIFLDILHRAIEEVLWLLELTEYDQKAFSNSYCQSAKCFHPKLAQKTLKQLLRASKAKSLYQLTDYHWLLLYEALWRFCELFNDEPKQIAPTLANQYGINEIAFHELIDWYFWDTDFFTSPDSLINIGEDGRKQMGFGEEAFGVVQRWVPHPEEIRIIRVSTQDAKEWGKARTEESPDLFQLGSQKYPSEVIESN